MVTLRYELVRIRSCCGGSKSGSFPKKLMARSSLYRFGPILLYASFTAFALRRVLVERTESLFAVYDASLQSFAWLSHNVRALQNWELPLWDFSTYSGVTHIGEMQTGALYPMQLMLLFREPLSQYTADCYVALHFVLGAVLMHLFLTSAGLRAPAAIVGALLFTFVGNVASRAGMQTNLYTGLIWVPLCLMGLERAARSRSFGVLLPWSLIAGIALGIMIFAGHIQAYAHSALALFIWALVLAASKQTQWQKTLLSLVVAGVASCMFALPQVIASDEYFRLAYKWYGEGFTRYPYCSVGRVQPAIDRLGRPFDSSSSLGPKLHGVGNVVRLVYGSIDCAPRRTRSPAAEHAPQNDPCHDVFLWDYRRVHRHRHCAGLAHPDRVARIQDTAAKFEPCPFAGAVSGNSRYEYRSSCRLTGAL